MLSMISYYTASRTWYFLSKKVVDDCVSDFHALLRHKEIAYIKRRAQNLPGIQQRRAQQRGIASVILL